MRTLLLVVSSLCHSMTSIAQIHNKIYDDLNKDGFNDSLICITDWGSGFSGTDCITYNGRTNNEIKWSTNFCYCSLMDVTLVPPELKNQENNILRLAMESILFHCQRKYPDPSLKWIISGISNNFLIEGNEIYSHIINPKVKWNLGNIDLPDIYTIQIFGDTLNFFLDDLLLYDYDKELQVNDSSSAYLNYYVHNHYRSPNGDSMTLVATDSTYSIYRTSHGVITQKKDQYKWVFVADNHIVNTQRKMRFESIGQVILSEGLLFIQQQFNYPSPDYNLWVVDIESGCCGMLRQELFCNYCSTELHIDDGKLIFTKITYDRKKIIDRELNIDDFTKELKSLCN